MMPKGGKIRPPAVAKHLRLDRERLTLLGAEGKVGYRHGERPVFLAAPYLATLVPTTSMPIPALTTWHLVYTPFSSLRKVRV